MTAIGSAISPDYTLTIGVEDVARFKVNLNIYILGLAIIGNLELAR